MLSRWNKSMRACAPRRSFIGRLLTCGFLSGVFGCGTDQPLLVEGLTDGPTYVRLMIKELPALDVVLAIRPMVGRITESAIMLGGKLSVFPLKDTLKAAPANEATMANWLKAAFPNVEWPKVSSRRVGTIVATPQTAPYYSGAEYLTAFKQSDTVEKMVAFIEQI